MDKRQNKLDTSLPPTVWVFTQHSWWGWGRWLVIGMSYSRGSVAPLLWICQVSMTKCQGNWELRVLARCGKRYRWADKPPRTVTSGCDLVIGQWKRHWRGSQSSRWSGLGHFEHSLGPPSPRSSLKGWPLSLPWLVLGSLSTLGFGGSHMDCTFSLLVRSSYKGFSPKNWN